MNLCIIDFQGKKRLSLHQVNSSIHGVTTLSKDLIHGMVEEILG